MYYGEKVCLRAYKEDDIEKVTLFVNDKELKKFYDTDVSFPIILWEEEKWVKSQKGNKNGEYNFAWDFIESFLKGYLKENRTDSYRIEKLPLFLYYRRICSYIFFTKIWDKKNIELR